MYKYVSLFELGDGEDDLVDEIGRLIEERWVSEDPAVTATIFEEEDQEADYHRRRITHLHVYIYCIVVIKLLPSV